MEEVCNILLGSSRLKIEDEKEVIDSPRTHNFLLDFRIFLTQHISTYCIIGGRSLSFSSYLLLLITLSGKLRALHSTHLEAPPYYFYWHRSMPSNCKPLYLLEYAVALGNFRDYLWKSGDYACFDTNPYEGLYSEPTSRTSQ